MNAFNVSATLNLFRLAIRPALCLPQATISTFNDLPVPLNKAFAKYKSPDIRALVLDKDNCFAMPHQNSIYKPYEVRNPFSRPPKISFQFSIYSSYQNIHRDIDPISASKQHCHNSVTFHLHLLTDNNRINSPSSKQPIPAASCS